MGGSIVDRVPRHVRGSRSRPAARRRRTALGAVAAAALTVLPASAAQATHIALQPVCRTTAAPTVTPLRPAWDGVDPTPTVSAVVTTGCATIEQVEVRLRRHGGPPVVGAQDVVTRAYTETTRTLRSLSLNPSYTVSFDLTVDEATDPIGEDLVLPRYQRDDRVALQWRLTFVRDGVRGSVTSAVLPFQVGCTPQQQVSARVAEQDALLGLLGPQGLTVLGDHAELLALANAHPDGGWRLPSHFGASFSGMGVAFVRDPFPPPPADPVHRFRPDLLLYAPGAVPADTNPFLPGNQGTFTDPVFDFPLTLVGWGYARAYAPGERPVGTAALAATRGLPCLPWEDWFLHEQGVHTPDGGFLPTPPPEERGTSGFFGASDGDALPLPAHGRLWDLHVWRRDAALGGPQVSILHPTRAIPGHPSGTSAFFYPNDITHSEEFAFGTKRGNRPPLPPA